MSSAQVCRSRRVCDPEESNSLAYVVLQASLQCSSGYFDPCVKQQEVELSVKTEDQLTKAPVTLDDSQLCPGKTLKQHSGKHNMDSF